MTQVDAACPGENRVRGCGDSLGSAWLAGVQQSCGHGVRDMIPLVDNWESRQRSRSPSQGDESTRGQRGGRVVSCDWLQGCLQARGQEVTTISHSVVDCDVTFSPAGLGQRKNTTR